MCTFRPGADKREGTKAWREIRVETNDENPDDPQRVFVLVREARGKGDARTRELLERVRRKGRGG